MKRKRREWKVDWSGPGAPEVGQIVGYMSPTSVFSSARIIGVRVVKNRVPLPPGASCRYAVAIERIDAVPATDVAWTCYAYARKRKPHFDPSTDPMSPLL